MTYEIPNDLGCTLDEPHRRHVLPENRGGGWCAGLVPAGVGTRYGVEALDVVREVEVKGETGYRAFVRSPAGVSNSGPW